MNPMLLADSAGPEAFLIVFGGMAVAGIAAFAAVVFLGLWIARRLRGKQQADPGEPKSDAEGGTP